MNENEIRTRHQVRKCESQIQFDRMMHDMNEDQSHMNHPLLDKERELLRQKELLLTQKKAIDIQLSAIRAERIGLEQKRKDVNRIFHDLKHQLIMLNPKEDYAKASVE